MHSSEITAGQFLRKPPKITYVSQYGDHRTKKGVIVFRSFYRPCYTSAIAHKKQSKSEEQEGPVAANNKRNQLVIRKTIEVMPPKIQSPCSTRVVRCL